MPTKYDNWEYADLRINNYLIKYSRKPNFKKMRCDLLGIIENQFIDNPYGEDLRETVKDVIDQDLQHNSIFTWSPSKLKQKISDTLTEYKLNKEKE